MFSCEKSQIQNTIYESIYNKQMKNMNNTALKKDNNESLSQLSAIPCNTKCAGLVFVVHNASRLAMGL